MASFIDSYGKDSSFTKTNKRLIVSSLRDASKDIRTLSKGNYMRDYKIERHAAN